MTAKQVWHAWFVVAGLTLIAVATVYAASAPAGPTVTVYRSPT